VASRADIEAGKAFIQLYLEDGKLHAGLHRARRTLLDFAASVIYYLSPSTWLKGIGEAVASIGRHAAVAGGAVAMAFIPAIKAASDATETLNKFNAVFGSQATSVGSWIDALSSRVGRSAVVVQDSISAYQAFFKGLGFGEEEAAKMSKSMAALAIDLGSFFNKSDEESNLRFLSALSGSSEVLDQFGINTKQAAIEAELAAMGINKAWTDVTEPEKVLARISIIRKSMAAQGAIGDAEKTRNSPANLWRAITGSINALATAVGTALLPTVAKIGQRIATALSVITEWAKANQGLIATIGDVVVSMITFGAGLFALGKALSFAGVLLATLTKFSMIGTVAIFVVPIVFKVVAALKVLSVGFFALKTVLGMVVPLMASFTIVATAVALGIVAIGVAWANATIKGITFGESVLDLTHKLTGIENAYSRLRDAEEQQEKGSAAIRKTEEAIKNRSGAEFTAGLEDLRKQRDEAANRLKEVEKEFSEDFSKRAAAMAGPFMTADKVPVNVSLQERVRAARLELARLEQNLNGLSQQRPIVIATPFLSNMGGREVRNAKEAGQMIGTAFWTGVTNVVKAQLRVVDEFLPILQRARAESIVDPQDREIALTNLDYDERVRRARAERLPYGTLEQAREQEIANIKAKYAREEAEKRLKLEQETQDEIARLKVETSQQGFDRDLALLRLKQQKEIEAARQAGSDIASLQKKHALEELKLKMGATRPQTSQRVAQTGWQALALAGGSSNILDRQHAEQKKQTDKLERIRKLAESSLRIQQTNILAIT